jgi:ABC-2 type transport system ATP-binding protein
MSESYFIEVDALSKTYRDGLFGRKKIEAVRGVSFQVKPGEIFGLLGPNGAGKTTIIKMLLGIVRKTKGQARLLGKPIGHRMSRLNVGYLPESHRMPLHHTGNSALAYYGKLSGMSRADVQSRAPEMLAMVGLTDWGTTPIKKYSKGMMQRLGLAQAMLHDPEVIILDEPTDGVDPVGRKEIRTVLAELKNRGKTIFLNSHLLQEIELVCDRVVILQNGLVVKEGDVGELTQHDQQSPRIHIAGSEADVRSALDGQKIDSLQGDGSGLTLLTLGNFEQSDIDRCVDALRAKRLSIVSIEQKKQTLEDAFLDVVLPPELES